MKNSESPAVGSFIGHVKNGVVILDMHVALEEGQAVRVEPVAPDGGRAVDTEQAEQLKKMQDLFARWDEEDKEVPDETAEGFHQALDQNRGLQFRVPKLD